jgi:Na+-transporting NADH:ubiquinone oxidoreductase subunit F
MWMPVLLMNAILAIVTILIIVADRFLLTYGDCTVRVSKGRESRSFTVRGGGTLMSALVENKVEVQSSCGGRGTCGYCRCRVASGGGQLLPTEDIFMTRQECAEGMRLACQVKVKGDVEVVIPDFLTIVRGMVAAKKFDARKRWRVIVK